MGGLGARAHLASGLLPGCGWPRWCGGAAACWLDMESCCLWSRCRAWVPVGLLLGLVVIHPVRERRSCCRCRPGYQGLLEEDHVF